MPRVRRIPAARLLPFAVDGPRACHELTPRPLMPCRSCLRRIWLYWVADYAGAGRLPGAIGFWASEHGGWWRG